MRLKMVAFPLKSSTKTKTLTVLDLISFNSIIVPVLGRINIYNLFDFCTFSNFTPCSIKIGILVLQCQNVPKP